MHGNLVSLLVAVALAAPAGAAQITASLRPTDNQDAAASGFRLADLTIENRGDSLVTGARLRNVDGGPVMIIDAAVPPASIETFRVHLPATSLQQSWLVALTGREEAALGTAVSVPITWPAELVTDEPFIAPEVYESLDDALASWPSAWKGSVLLASVLGGLAAGATLLIRRPVLRLVAATVVVLAATGAAAVAVATIPTVVERTIADGGAVLHVLSARRTVRWHSGEGGMYPLYRTGRHMRSDDTKIHVGKGVWMTLRPQEVRCLRRPSAIEK